jgi:hypothetical protein
MAKFKLILKQQEAIEFVEYDDEFFEQEGMDEQEQIEFVLDANEDKMIGYYTDLTIEKVPDNAGD